MCMSRPLWTRSAGWWGWSRSRRRRAGYEQLAVWLHEFGPVARVGVEGTGAYGAGLARSLRHVGIEVIEGDRANRQARRQRGKSDPADAVEAARAAQRSGR